MLAVGAVDYGRAGNEAGVIVRRGRPRDFEALPATRGEVESIRALFERRHPDAPATVLTERAATESAFREAARDCAWLHLATHGFFAPAGLRSVLEPARDGVRRRTRGPTGVHPGLLSGLVFAGANAVSASEEDDGILTALEVASLDLSGVEVAALSACETGLGEVAGGEGVLGLQRAFQVAGARTTVTSLWSVPDRATRLLMERFYRNLWERKLSRLESLREAQLWMFREAAADDDVRRGLEPERRPAAADEAGPLHPFFWAAFALSGDWR
jgi:CHAT domain-containing protein